jgi:hypothetical protein
LGPADLGLHRGKLSFSVRPAPLHDLSPPLDVTIEYPPPDADGRPYIWIVFDFGKTPELDLGGTMATIRKRQLELSEGVGVIPS